MRSDRHSALRRVYLSESREAGPGSSIVLDGEKLTHLRKVLRMEWGQELRVLDGQGRELEAVLEQSGSRGAVRLGRVARQEPQPLGLDLMIGLPKNVTMDWVIEKSVECGATRITPFIASRSVVRPAEGEGGKYLRRWNQIAQGALEQSERLWCPEIGEPLPWHEFVAVCHANRDEACSIMFASELRAGDVSEAELVSHCVEALREAKGRGIRLVIGPEGGLADTEHSELIASGFSAESLGLTVLRVETAVVAALTLARVIRMVSAS